VSKKVGTYIANSNYMGFCPSTLENSLLLMSPKTKPSLPGLRDLYKVATYIKVSLISRAGPCAGFLCQFLQFGRILCLINPLGSSLR